MKVVVVGGVAGGMSFAARARRLGEDAEIVVLERDPYVSFANCGLPYHLSGEIPDRADLLLHTPESLADILALDVRTGHEVVAVDRENRTVEVRERETGRSYTETYDALVLSTGAAPVVPPLPGTDLPQVRVLRTVPDADALRAVVEDGARRAVVVGAGFIGLEVAEAFRHRGLEVTVVELAPQVLTPLDPEMARSVQDALVRAGVTVRLGVGLAAIHPAGGDLDPVTGSGSAAGQDQPGSGQGPAGQDRSPGVVVELGDGTRLPADVVLLAMGVRPESTLARQAGLELAPNGAVLVDEHLRTSDPAVYAVGDAIAVRDAVTGALASIPLAGPANRQGRAAADHLFGRGGRNSPVLGTAIVRVFDVTAASTGRPEKALRAAGVPFHAVHLHPNHHAGYYPGARSIHLKVLFAPDGRLLGAQATGGEGVDKRIDVLATALRAGLDVRDLADLELSYAPPFGSAKDPVNMAGFLAENLLAGDVDLWYPDELAEPAGENGTDVVEGVDGIEGVGGPTGRTGSAGENGAPALVDVRSAAEYAAGHLPGAVNIPQPELRERLGELPAGVPLRVYCAAGFRSYLALRILRQSGFDDVRSLSGGIRTFALARPEVRLATAEAVRAR
jgi:NADPH-dependent 2,4-dienoyl-CoA reductase/sulfur reductase-like enzyme/rhodanese-related sulfurtransferase